MFEFVIKYWLEVAFGLIVCAITYYIKKQRAIQKGVRALLRNELIRRYREYEIKGELTILDKENIEHMYNEYKALRGNGTVAKMYEDLMNLETKIIKG